MTSRTLVKAARIVALFAAFVVTVSYATACSDGATAPTTHRPVPKDCPPDTCHGRTPTDTMRFGGIR